MLTSSRKLFVLDRYRIPYSVEGTSVMPGIGRLTAATSGARELLWAEPSGEVGAYSFRGLPFVGALATAEELRAALGRRRWERDIEITTPEGAPAGWTFRADDGSVLLPFDPDELIWGTLAERYVRSVRSRGRERARRAYYSVRGALPRDLQMALRRRYARVQNRQRFPDWPAETRLHEIFSWFFDVVEAVAGEPVPWIAWWPEGLSWALVLTHDVEHAAGYDFIEDVVSLERSVDVRSAWFFVPERDYTVADERIRALGEAGFEVGLHGLRHDGRDLDPLTFTQRLPAMRSYAERWGADGFRSPSTLRHWELMPRLGLDYDTSYSDSARYEPIAGGSCTWLPFFIGDTLELPMTMPMDHTLFELLKQSDESMWLEKASFLKQAGGMALLLTHPDYLLESDRLEVYGRFLESTIVDPSLWVALPREVSAWWRARYASTPVATADGWAVDGPASDRGTIVLGRSAGPESRAALATD
jgi:peptidoglycan/xylan/chitin deacetylase (PgdA/CDA1 family)